MFPSAHNKTCPGTEGERCVSPSGDNLVPKKALPRQPPTKQILYQICKKTGDVQQKLYKWLHWALFHMTGRANGEWN